MKLYKSYVFKTKDPIIDELHTAIDDVGDSFRRISKNSGVSTSTLHNWFYGSTRRPQHATVMAVARAIGYDMKLVKKNDIAAAQALLKAALKAQKKRITKKTKVNP